MIRRLELIANFSKKTNKSEKLILFFDDINVGDLNFSRYENFHKVLIANISIDTRKYFTKNLNTPFVFINDLWVERNFRCQKVGTILLSKFIELFQKTSEFSIYENIYLESDPSDDNISEENLFAFYNKFGFERINKKLMVL